MACPQCGGVGWTIRKVGQDTFAKRCNLCRPGSLFNPRKDVPKKKRGRK